MTAILSANTHTTSPSQSSEKLEIGDLLLNYLEQLGVQYVFGVPGGAIEPLYNALARSARRGSIQPVVARHETGAAFMAQGYSMETGKLGVCCVTTGPGATNVLTGVASAYMDEVPMLVISGQTSGRNFGRGALQDSSSNGIDTLGIFQHCTRYNTLISDISQFEEKFVGAVNAALGEPKGPAHITIPVDLMRSQSRVSIPSFNIQNLLEPPSLIDINALAFLLETLAKSKHLVIVVGEGCFEAIEQILYFAELTNAYLVATPGGKGLVDPYHPLYRGIFGFAGHSSARDILTDPLVDYVLAVGTGLGEWDTAGWDNALLNKRLIHIDPAKAHFARSPMAHMHIQGRIVTIFQHILQKITGQMNLRSQARGINTLEQKYDQEKTKQPAFMPYPDSHLTEQSNGVAPQFLMSEIAHRLPPGTRFFADAGNSIAWTVHYLHSPHMRKASHSQTNWFRTSTQFASMGWAIGTAVGAAIGDPNNPVVCITGDGSLLMNGQELTVAVAEQLNIIFLVLNDSAYGMVKHGQRMTGAEPIAFGLPRVDFFAMAKAMGAKAYRLHNHSELKALDIEALVNSPGPTLLDVHIDPEATPPMGTRVKVLGGAS